MTTNQTTPSELTAGSYVHPMQQAVAEFHDSFGLPNLIGRAQALPQDRIELRLGLIIEESVHELREALHRNNVVGTIDALIDSAYVALGALVEMGYDANANTMRYTVATSDHSKPLAVLASRYHFANDERIRSLRTALRAADAGVSSYTLSVIAGKALQVLGDAGINPEPFFAEVQRSNMSKLGTNGKPIHSRGVEIDGYPKGKVLKGPNYSEPDLRRVYLEQGFEL